MLKGLIPNRITYLLNCNNDTICLIYKLIDNRYGIYPYLFTLKNLYKNTGLMLPFE